MEIVQQIERHNAIIEGTEKIINNWEIDKSLFFNKKFQQVSIGEICILEYGDSLPETKRRKGKYPVIGAGKIIDYHNEYLTSKPAITIGRRGATSGRVLWVDEHCFPIDTAFYVINILPNKLNYKFLYYSLKILDLMKLQSGSAMPGVNRNDIYNQKINLPNLEEQK